jgi:hypothetical protein
MAPMGLPSLGGKRARVREIGFNYLLGGGIPFLSASLNVVGYDLTIPLPFCDSISFTLSLIEGRRVNSPYSIKIILIHLFIYHLLTAHKKVRESG